MFVIALAAALLSGQDASPSQRSASDLTRDLNSGPPFAVPAPSQTAPTQPAPTQAAPTQAASPPVLRPTTPVQTPAPAAPPSSRQTRDLNTAPSSAVRPATIAPAPVASSVAGSAPTTPIAPGPQTAAPRPVVATPPVVRPPAAQPAPSRPAPTPVQPQPSVAEAPAPHAAALRGLDAAGIAALPFRLDLPVGAILTQARAGADAFIYSVRQNDRVLVMIYAGPASQFPIYDGQMIRAGGRATVVVTEDGRRLAMEHLFQRAIAPQEIHVWVAAAEGADRDLGERIAQSVDAR
jgi:hypothetical protein